MKERITEDLIEWYRINQRDLPWRRTKNAYYIWISEIMLQQTRVETVIDYYKRFISFFPTLKDLANADEDTLLKAWEGLGYYSRVRNMQKTARILVGKKMKTLPNNEHDLLELPGIGAYTAGAILSIAYDVPSPAIDGNVYRVIGRVYEIKESISKPKTHTIYKGIMESLLPNKDTAYFTQSFMDLGSSICTPKQPKCEGCPLKEKCLAFKHKRVEEFPVKEKKKKKRVENRIVFLFLYQDKVAICKRENKGLLAALYEFPNELLPSNTVEKVLEERNIHYQNIEALEDVKHVFSHIIWHLKGYAITVVEPMKEFIWVTKEELKYTYSLPSAFSKYVKYFIERK